MKEKTILIKTENGKTLEGLILFTFEANGDNFVLYQIEDKVHSAKVDQEGNLSPVLEDEWKLVEKVYNQYLEENTEEEDE